MRLSQRVHTTYNLDSKYDNLIVPIYIFTNILSSHVFPSLYLDITGPWRASAAAAAINEIPILVSKWQKLIYYYLHKQTKGDGDKMINSLFITKRPEDKEHVQAIKNYMRYQKY
jgi:hypothetical protein